MKTAYRLTPSEILLAYDEDLSEYIGLKRLAPYHKQRDAWYAIDLGIENATRAYAILL